MNARTTFPHSRSCLLSNHLLEDAPRWISSLATSSSLPLLSPLTVEQQFYFEQLIQKLHEQHNSNFISSGLNYMPQTNSIMLSSMFNTMCISAPSTSKVASVPVPFLAKPRPQVLISTFGVEGWPYLVLSSTIMRRWTTMSGLSLTPVIIPRRK